MGFWTKAAGVALAGTGIAIGNPLLIGAGAKVIGTDISAEGAKKAAQQQIDATEKARADANARYDAAKAEQKAIYEKSSGAFAPYIGLGQGVLPNLGSMVGLSPAATPTTLPQSTAPAAPMEPAATEPTGVQAMTMAPAQARAERNTASMYGKRGDGGLRLANLGGLVLVQSPDGEQRVMSRARADEALARGAREV